MIAVIDYGMGNLHSIHKALEHAAPEERIVVSGDPATIRAADRVVFPGVGAIRDCMAELSRTGLDDVVRECARGKPLLGVCLGMQALMDFSEENDGVPGLGVMNGRCVRFGAALVDDAGHPLKVPHMGWNRVEPARPHCLWDGIEPGSRFYFVHSYYVAPDEAACIAAETGYPAPFASAIARGNVFAVQFHPEKSQRAGLRLLANFATWKGESCC